MASIFPFEAVRPTRDKVCLVTCRSYEEYVHAELAAQYRAPVLKGPFNIEARLAAGFEPEEIVALQKENERSIN